MLIVVNTHNIRIPQIEIKAYLQSALPKNRAMPKAVIDAMAAPDALEVSPSSNGAAPSFIFNGAGHCPTVSQDKLSKQSDD